MNKEQIINTILLKPRFSCSTGKTTEEIFDIFKYALESNQCSYCHVTSANHIFIDVPPEKSHFWSPQLQIKIEEDEAGKTFIKGVIGPKPHIWTLFMFLYFFAGAALIFSFIWFYVNWTLDEPYRLQLYLIYGIIVFIFLLYLAGQIGKRLAAKQTEELKHFLSEIIQNSVL